MPNAYNAGMIAAGLVLAIGFGVAFAWTRSLLPSVVAHAIINVPMTPLWLGIVLAVLVISAVVAARWGAAVVRQVFSGATVVGCVALAVVGTAYAIASQHVEELVFAAAAMVVLAVGIEAVDRKRDRIA